MTTEVLYINNDNTLEVDALQDEVTGSYINNATVEATLYEIDRTTVVSGQTFPLTLAYVSASNGKYRATLSDSLNLDRRKRYVVHITADGGPGLMGDWWINARALNRG